VAESKVSQLQISLVDGRTVNDMRFALFFMSALMCVFATLCLVFDAEDPMVYAVCAVAYAIGSNAWKGGAG